MGLARRGARPPSKVSQQLRDNRQSSACHFLANPLLAMPESLDRNPADRPFPSYLDASLVLRTRLRSIARTQADDLADAPIQTAHEGIGQGLSFLHGHRTSSRGDEHDIWLWSALHAPGLYMHVSYSRRISERIADVLTFPWTAAPGGRKGGEGLRDRPC